MALTTIAIPLGRSTDIPTPSSNSTIPSSNSDKQQDGHYFGPVTDAILAVWIALLDRYSPDVKPVFFWGFSDPPDIRMSTDDVRLDRSGTAAAALASVREFRLKGKDEECVVDSITLHAYLDSDDTAADVNPRQHILPRFTAELASLSVSIYFPSSTPSIQTTAFKDLLTSILSPSTQDLLLSSLLTQPSSRDLSTIWSTYNSPLPEIIPKCMHDIITSQALSTPSAPAVHAWDGDLAYGELDALSSSLAQRLVAQGGVTTGTLVPLCFEKSKWAVVTVLAVMKAGGGFVFLSPAQPEERLRTILGEVGGNVIVSSQQQADLAATIAPGQTHIIVSLDTIHDEEVLNAITLPSSEPSSILYVIFTSGSTGTPKGVTISHTTYTSGAIPRAAAVGYTSKSRVLDFAAYVFDVSIDCMLCTLAIGGTICVPSEEDRMNSLGAAIKKLDVNMAHMTPSVARVLEPEVMASLDVLGLGGEAVSSKDAAVWSKRTKVVVAYGPSECTVGCTINNDVRADMRTSPYASIGRGVGGMMWIVDPEDHNKLVPIGAVGELVVEGPVVGQGYLNRPDLTEQVFINDPDWLLDGYGDVVEGRRGTLYKTGDLVAYALDGSGRINFVARKDQQVKIRGQRVELAEIEHHLHDNLSKNTAVAVEVITPGGAESEPMLVAFVVEPNRLSRPTAGDGELVLSSFSRDFDGVVATANDAIAGRLPIYMIPSAYIPLATMPTLVSAKTDRKALRAIGFSMTRPQLAKLRTSPAMATQALSKPTTKKEKLLASLWSQVIGPDVNPGTNDNFFLLGGDSLKAMRLVAAARKEGMTLSVGTIFTHPSLSSMASTAILSEVELSQETSEPQPFSLLPPCWIIPTIKTEAARLCNISTDQIEDIYPCTPLQEGLMALSAKIPDAYVAQRVVTLKDAATAAGLQAAFKKMAEDSAILRTRIIQVPAKGLLQVVTRPPIHFHAGTNLDQYLAADRTEPMELGTALARYAVVQTPTTSPNDSKAVKVNFVLTIHHALYDGWSMQLIVERVNHAFQKRSLQPATSFKSWIKFLGSQNRKGSEKYWRNYLEGASGPQFPPHPYAGYQTRADSLLERYISVPPATTGARANTTVATVIRAAWAIVAARELGIEDVVFGETLTGRNAALAGVEGIEGPMITTVPMRVAVTQDVIISKFLEEIQEQSVARIPHENLGLQHVRRLSPDAREACELKTGLVLHPAEDGKKDEDGDEEPANGFVPTDDAEAAREALNFNTYALMLVCSLDARGFLVMASFDSRTVEVGRMERLLRQMEGVVRQLYGNLGEKLGDVVVVDNEDVREAWKIAFQVVVSPEDRKFLGLTGDTIIKSAWVVDSRETEKLLPVGAVGEVLLECLEALSAERIKAPKWLTAGHGEQAGQDGQLYRTGHVGRFAQNGQLILLGPVTSWANHQAQGQTPKEAIPDNKTPSSVSPAEKQLLRLWSRNLSLSETDIDPNDSFFALGGDSITAMKLVSEARHLSLKLTVADIFKHKTLAALSQTLSKHTTSPVLSPSPTRKAKALIPPAFSPKPKTPRPKTPDTTVDSGYHSPTTASPPLLPASTSSLPTPKAPPGSQPFSSLIHTLLHTLIHPQLNCGPNPQILDVLPVRPLQDIAIHGTIANPKFSVRYEMLHFTSSTTSSTRLLSACQALVQNNEILRTVFVASPSFEIPGMSSSSAGNGGKESHLAVILQSLSVPISEFHLSPGGDRREFARMWCKLDVQTTMPLGSSFVKFMVVSTGEGGDMTLVVRISHAQYDEMSLPSLLGQLRDLYEHGDEHSDSNVPITKPATEVPTVLPTLFSTHVHNLLPKIPSQIETWRHLLSPTSSSPLPFTSPKWPPFPTPGEARKHFAIETTITLPSRRPDVTLATIPPAAWALVLAKLSRGNDSHTRPEKQTVMFGEVVSGRSSNHDPSQAQGTMVVGPTWQYAPCSIPLRAGMTGSELLDSVQKFHGEIAEIGGVSLREMVGAGLISCWTPPWEQDLYDTPEEPWFPTVVHQAVSGTGRVKFGGEKGMEAELETLYVHEEPLREVKVQAFIGEGSREVTLEIVTFEGWREWAGVLLEEMKRAFVGLVERPGEVVV